MPDSGETLDREEAPTLADFGRAEADDARRLAEKIASFEGEPTTVVAKPRWSADPGKAFERSGR